MMNKRSESYKVTYEGTYRFIDEESLQTLLGKYSLSSRLPEVVKANKRCIIKKDLDWLHAKALNHQLQETGINTQVRVHFTPESWQQGLKNKTTLPQATPAHTPVNKTNLSERNVNSRQSSHEEPTQKTTRVDFKTKGIRPGAFLPPRTNSAIQPALNKSHQINLKTWSIPKALILLLALAVSAQLTLKVTWVAELPVALLARQAFLMIHFLGLTTLLFWACYSRKLIEVRGGKKRFFLKETTEVWHKELSFEVYDASSNLLAEINVDEDNTVATWTDLSGISQDIITLTQQKPDDQTLNEITKTAYEDLLPSFLLEGIEFFSSLIPSRKKAEKTIESVGEIRNQDDIAIATFEVSETLELQIAQADYTAEAIALTASILVRKK